MSPLFQPCCLDFGQQGVQLFREFVVGLLKMKKSTPLIAFTFLAFALAVIGCKKQQRADEKDIALFGRHMSESQVADIAFSQLPPGSGYRCEFKDGVWEVLEVQKNVWGVSSRTTNAEGKVVIASTNATRVVLRVRDADGKVEPVNTP